MSASMCTTALPAWPARRARAVRKEMAFAAVTTLCLHVAVATPDRPTLVLSVLDKHPPSRNVSPNNALPTVAIVFDVLPPASCQICLGPEAASPERDLGEVARRVGRGRRNFGVVSPPLA